MHIKNPLLRFCVIKFISIHQSFSKFLEMKFDIPLAILLTNSFTIIFGYKTNSALFKNLYSFESENVVPSALWFFIRHYGLEDSNHIDVVVRFSKDDSWKYSFEFLDDFLRKLESISFRLDVQSRKYLRMEISEPRLYYLLLFDDIDIFPEIIMQLSKYKIDNIGKFFVYILGSTPNFYSDYETLRNMFITALRVNVFDIVILSRSFDGDASEIVEVHTYFPFNAICYNPSGTKLGWYIPGTYKYYPSVEGRKLFQKKYNKSNHCGLTIGVLDSPPFLIVDEVKGRCFV